VYVLIDYYDDDHRGMCASLVKTHDLNSQTMYRN